MKLFLDTANLEEIRTIKRWGVLGGCTTNPSLLAKEHNDWEVQMKEVCAEVDGPVSLETTSTAADDLYEEGLRLAGVAPNAVVKVAMTPEGLQQSVRISQVILPCYTYVAETRGGDILFHAWVPRDDSTCWTWDIWFNEEKAIDAHEHSMQLGMVRPDEQDRAARVPGDPFGDTPQEEPRDG